MRKLLMVAGLVMGACGGGDPSGDSILAERTCDEMRPAIAYTSDAQACGFLPDFEFWMPAVDPDFPNEAQQPTVLAHDADRAQVTGPDADGLYSTVPERWDLDRQPGVAVKVDMAGTRCRWVRCERVTQR